MEFLQGRVMLNAIGNLKLTGPNAEALSKLGHKLEDVACQVHTEVLFSNGSILRCCTTQELLHNHFKATGPENRRA
ncbi:hypothetical protein QN277_019473 [Acacia crassicarpa]|uniref:Uncharacterized protein n=1 Tax=Acacia crassicarpa TaxID=499986 RepID=A0AAE1JHS1_9FABA|nr:hypothetical protein QN277_019473 [Acacia crassicarpa]